MTLKVADVHRTLRKLPLRRRWTFDETPLDWDFSMKRGGLRPLDEAAYDFPLKAAWLTLLIFGELEGARTRARRRHLSAACR
jgi:hypothetical protein